VPLIARATAMTTVLNNRQHPKKTVILSRLLLLASLSLSAFACGVNVIPESSNPSAPVVVPTPQLANQLIANGETAEAAKIYEQLAGTETDPALRYDYLLNATELNFDSELYNEGRRLFATLPASPEATQSQARLQVLTAYNTLAQGDHQQALATLPPIRSITDRFVRIRSLELQSRAHQLLSQPESALKARILLESNLEAASSIAVNRSKIATMLSNIDTDGLRQMARTPGGTIYRGWLEYSALARQQDTIAPELFARRSQAWNANYPNHPAAVLNVAGTQVAGSDLQALGTEQVALLLPLTGRFSAIGQAIKTGFIAARFEDGGTGNIKLYDTASDSGTAMNQYSLATSEGASMIIGPLDKSAVINLTANNRISVPTLSLNYIGEEMTGNANLFQFGLLPEDEARDAARYGIAENYRKAIIIASDSPISQRLASAFEVAFTDAGGSVLATETIAVDSYDFSQQLTKMLDINSSNARKRRLEKLLEAEINFEPAIRSDIDVVFIAVDSEQAILLRPQLQFHRAGKLPLLSTSQIFSGDIDANRDGDLTGIKYNDIPWNLTDATNKTALYTSINVNHQDSIQKLVALGIDAYQLHRQLDNMRLDPTHSINGKTGALTLADGNRIRRRLEWAEYQEGIPVKILDALPIETALPPLESEL